MNDVGVVRGLQGVRDTLNQARGADQVQSTAHGAGTIAQSPAADQAHDDVDDLVFLAEVVDGHQVRVEQPRQESCFVVEAFAHLAIGGQARRHHLERDVGFERPRIGSVDRGHATPAEDIAHHVLAVAQRAPDQGILHLLGYRPASGDSAKGL